MKVIDLDLMPYRDAWRRQEDVHADVAAGGTPTLLLVEHPPTITLGRRAEASRGHVLVSPAQLKNLGVEVVQSDRGGDVTFHGPGQVVAYPVVRLADLGLSVGGYMRILQESAAAALGDLHVSATVESGAPGVWIECQQAAGPGKVCAVGVRVKKGVTLHGLALNVEPDMSYFDLIDPCGLGRPVTSLHRVLGSRSPSMQAVKAVLSRRLVEALGEVMSDE